MILHPILSIIDNIKKKQWSKSGFDFLKLASDLLGGLSLVLVICYLTKVNCLILFTVAFFAILPDILLGLKWMFPGNELLRKHFEFHYKIHFSENKKIPALGRIAVEFLVVLAAFLLLLA